jgi:hypothetical protein
MSMHETIPPSIRTVYIVYLYSGFLLSIHRLINPSIPPSISIYLAADRSTYILTYLPTYLPIYLSIYLSI